MASNVIIMDSEFVEEMFHIKDGINEFKDIVEEYKIILDELTKEGVVDKSINNAMIEKVNYLKNAIYKVEPIVSSIFMSTFNFLNSVEEKDKLKK